MTSDQSPSRSACVHLRIDLTGKSSIDGLRYIADIVSRCKEGDVDIEMIEFNEEIPLIDDKD